MLHIFLFRGNDSSYVSFQPERQLAASFLTIKNPVPKKGNHFLLGLHARIR